MQSWFWYYQRCVVQHAVMEVTISASRGHRAYTMKEWAKKTSPLSTCSCRSLSWGLFTMLLRSEVSLLCAAFTRGHREVSALDNNMWRPSRHTILHASSVENIFVTQRTYRTLMKRNASKKDRVTFQGLRNLKLTLPTLQLLNNVLLDAECSVSAFLFYSIRFIWVLV